MKRVTIAAAVCAGVLGVSAPGASADPLDRCETTATWKVHLWPAPAYADRTIHTTHAACNEVPSVVRVRLDAVFTSGLPTDVFAAVATDSTGSRVGVVEGTDAGRLNANLASRGPAWAADEVHRASGGCGNGCYRTNVTVVVGG
jgi:hypothetical protein